MQEELQRVVREVEAYSLKHRIIGFNKKILIACSGGPDSLALAIILLELQKKYQLELGIAHVEHGIRGKESLEDAQFVEQFCKEYNLPCYMTSIEALAIAKQQKQSVELVARELRYEFLLKICKQKDYNLVCTGHHLNDNAETFLLHLLRGAGPEGLEGIRPLSQLQIQGETLLVGRPLRSLSRTTIETFCEHLSLKPRQDSTNYCSDYMRNKVRLDLLPQLGTYNPQIIQALDRTSRLITLQDDFIQQAVDNSYECLTKLVTKTSCQLKSQELIDLHPLLRYGLYRRFIENLLGDTKDISLYHIDKIDKFLYNGTTGKYIQLPRNLIITQQYGDIIFSLASQTSSNSWEPIELTLEELYRNKTTVLQITPDIQLELVWLTAQEFTWPVKTSVNECYIPICELSEKLYIRPRKQGDRMQPEGMKGHKKLKDILIDAKIPADLRDLVPVIADDNGVLWLVGIRRATRGSITKVKEVLYIKKKSNN